MPELDEKDLEQLAPLIPIQEYLYKIGVPHGIPIGSPEQISGQISGVRRFLNESGQARKSIQELLTNVIDPQTGKKDISAGRHITEFNPDEIRAQANKLLESYKDTIDRLATLKKNIDARLDAVADSLSVDVTEQAKKDIALRMAIRRTFGQKTTVITWDMYKQALALRDRLYSEDLDEATADSPVERGKNIAKYTGSAGTAE